MSKGPGTSLGWRWCVLLMVVLLLGPVCSAFHRLRDELHVPLSHGNMLEPLESYDWNTTSSVSLQGITTVTSVTMPSEPSTASATMPSEPPTASATTPSELPNLSPTSNNSPSHATTTAADDPGVLVITVGQDGALEKNQDYFLPKSLRPVHYVIKVQPFINGNYSIHGFMEVEVEVLEPTSNITLHALDMSIQANTVKLAAVEEETAGIRGRGERKRGKDSVPRVKHFTVNVARQFFTAHLTRQLLPGRRYRYSMSYVGSLAHQWSGFFAVEYTDSDGTKRRLVSSLLQATHARKAFPCFDEPALKATFELHVVRETNMTAISNMPLLHTTPREGEEGWVVDRFQTSPPMSTYFLVLIVSQLQYVHVTNPGALPIRVWARPEALPMTSLVQQEAPKLLAFFENYLGVAFSLPKLDLVALPGTLGTAFEGWGIILCYDEKAMMYDGAVDSDAHKELVTYVLAHELAHQWFGNLVTPRWWIDLWLSEGFASYLQYLSVSNVMPWRVSLERQVFEVTGDTLHIDSQPSSHHIRMPVFNPQQIWDQFDAISYYKGSSVIHMMSNFLSETTFRKGLTNFLTGCQYKTADQDTLWRYMTAAARLDGSLPSDVSVKMIMDTWTLQAGYPVIKVVRNPDGTSATVYQEKVVVGANTNVSESNFPKWWVPLSYTSQDDLAFNHTQPRVWMRNTESQVMVPALPRKDQWVIFNLKRAGYYRVTYDLHNWNLIVKQLLTDHSVIHVLNRAQLVDDALELALAGQLSYKTALDVTQYVEKEDDLLVFQVLLENMMRMETLLRDTPAYGGFKKYLLSLLVPLYSFLDLQNETQAQDVLREHTEVLSWLCELDHPDCIHLANVLYRQWMDTPKLVNVPEEIRETVYCTAIANGGEEEWQFAWRQYFLTSDDKLKDQLLKALGCSKDPWVKAGYLDMAFTTGVKLRGHDTFQVFSSVASRVPGQNVAWNFLLKNWDDVTAMFGKHDGVDEPILKAATSTFNSKQHLMELQIFKKAHKNQESVVRASESAMERTNANMAWMERNYDVICEWLEAHGFSTKLRVY